jgi:hypothetical protein
LKAPRLIARSLVFFRQVEGVETGPRGFGSETDRNPFTIRVRKFLSLFKG